MGGSLKVLKRRFADTTDGSLDHNEIWRPWKTRHFSDISQDNSNTIEESEPQEEKKSTHYKVCTFPNCDVEFGRESERRRHEKTIHNGQIMLCKFCPMTFTRADNLRRHMQMKHTIDVPRCPFCSKRLSRQDAVQRHMMTCYDNPHNGQSLHTLNWANPIDGVECPGSAVVRSEQ